MRSLVFESVFVRQIVMGLEERKRRHQEQQHEEGERFAVDLLMRAARVVARHQRRRWIAPAHRFLPLFFLLDVVVFREEEEEEEEEEECAEERFFIYFEEITPCKRRKDENPLFAFFFRSHTPFFIRLQRNTRGAI